MTEDSVLTRLQFVELSILEVVGSLCDKFGINWWLDGGTCLGAMRHKGFIPWDDDIDIGMMRSDYDRFCSIASTELPDGYSFHDSRNSPGYAAMFCKVYKDGTRFENQEGGTLVLLWVSSLMSFRTIIYMMSLSLDLVSSNLL